MPRALAALALPLLLALPIGLATSLASDALLRLGLWLDPSAPPPGSPSVPGVVGASTPAAPGANRTAADAPPGPDRLAAETALRSPLPVALPHAETLALGLDADPVRADAFELVVSPPGLLRVATRAAPGATGGLVVELFDADATDASGRPRRLAAHGPGDLELRLPAAALAGRASPGAGGAPREVRLVALVRGVPGSVGRFALVLEAVPALGFPVATDAPSPVRSFFGVARDGGRRKHHGIDVFAERGTPVLAAADGIVVRTGDSPRGGLHVWQRAVDGAGASIGALYYAHLDRIDVVPGERVTRGASLGTVGNTGNARTTPPHLHFGLYRRFTGPEDPLPLTGPRRVRSSEPVPEPAAPRWLAVLAPRANLRAGPGTDRDIVATAEAGELLRVEAIGAGGRWVRVTAGGGVRGWIARSLVGAPMPAAAALADAAQLRASPDGAAATLGRVEGGADVELLGRFGAALRVRSADGLIGWTDAPPSP